MPYRLPLYKHWRRLILVLTHKLQCLDLCNTYPNQYLNTSGFFDKYTNTTSFYNLSAVCSIKSIAININLIKFRFLRWCSEKPKLWGKFRETEFINSSVFSFKPQIFWWNIVIEILLDIWWSFTIKISSFFIVGVSFVFWVF